MKTFGFRSFALILLVAAVIQTANAQPTQPTKPTKPTGNDVVFKSQKDGKWIAIDPTAYDFGAANGYASQLPGNDYRDTRWDGFHGLINFNQSNFTNSTIVGYPGSSAQNPNLVEINNHHIVLDASSGLTKKDSFSIWNLNVASGGVLDVDSVSFNAAETTNAGTVNFVKVPKFTAYSFDNKKTVEADKSKLEINLINNAGTFRLANSSNLSKTYQFDNNGTFSLDNSSASIQYYRGLGSDKILEIKNGSSLNVYRIDVVNNSQISVTGKGNKITGNANGQGTGNLQVAGNILKISGTDWKKDQLDVNVPILFNNNSSYGEVRVTNTTMNYLYTNNNNLGNLVIVGDSRGRIGGLGNTGVTYGFTNGSFFDPGNTSDKIGAVGNFAAKDVIMQRGSTVYIDIGSSNWDKVVAQESISFGANSGDNVNVVLLNFGNHNATVKASDVFTAKNDRIYIGNQNLDSANVTQTGNKVTISNGGATVTVASATSLGGDAVKINKVIIDWNNGKTLGFDVTGVQGINADPRDPNSPVPSPSTPSTVKPLKNTPILGGVLLGMTDSSLFKAIRGYAGNDNDKWIAAINQLDPIISTATVMRTQNDVMVFSRTIERRMQLQRDNVPFEEFSYGSYRGQTPNPTPYPAPIYQSRLRPATRELWADVLGDFIDQNDRNELLGYSGSTGGFSIGMDKRIHNFWVLGIGLGGAFSKLTGNHSSAKGSVDNYMLALYGSYAYGDWQMCLSGGLAYGNVKTTRYADLIESWASGGTDSAAEFISFELSRRFGTECQYITPFFGLDYAGVQQKGYTERGTYMNMRLDKHQSDAYLQTFGVRFGNAFQWNCWLLTPEFTVGWIHDYGRGNISNSGRFVAGGTPFVLTGTLRNNDRALLGFGIDIKTNSRFKIFARYDGELTHHYDNSTVQLGFGLNY